MSDDKKEPIVKQDKDGQGADSGSQELSQVDLPPALSVKQLADLLGVSAVEVIKQLMRNGVMANINQAIDFDTAAVIAANFGYKANKQAVPVQTKPSATAKGGKLSPCPPVITIMGHVDHGKTSLLDAIRQSNIIASEAGAITQHIGAYQAEVDGRKITFLDTPGHEAFTAMRARGARATNIAVLVVAADDGVMPQTVEAINHARAADVPIVVAINKCDLASANPDKVKTGLQKEDLAPEDRGGNTVMVEVSATTGEGVDSLVEMLMLESEMLELKANPNLRARGVVIESRKTPGQGVTVTLLVQNGTLKNGDVVMCKNDYGRVKAMLNDVGSRVENVLPATPVEVLGLQGVPESGEEFYVVKDEKKAKTLIELKQGQRRKDKRGGSRGVTLEGFHDRLLEGSMKELKIILKADVQGSIEALQQSLEELSTDEVKLESVHSAVGDINESDIMLAVVSNAIIIGFHVKVDVNAEAIQKRERIDVHLYDVIYEAIADVKAGMEGLLEPDENEVFQGRAEVREVFSASKIGKAAGCMVIKGTIHRKDRVRIKRAKETIHEGEINALRRFKNDAKDVKEGFECGITIKNFTDIRTGDIIETYIIEKIARRLEK
ncbi:MAG: translation initiation factor IF-2 [Candidatus Omnitrophica bacterium]|nr:translation initiation factor IF-2 [Candidatus Omnitrophota bacterium]